ncbi:MAG TPA: RIP metalloprotease RseP [Acidobacteriaceae bacterium]|nr:RIP metalloprotease RseP [Acidobacteriaceae bacterium]
MITVIQLLLVLGLMVLVHELGHFVLAKWCGVRVEAFAIGFGKRLWGFHRGGTDYRINILPFGGYVKMAGEIPGEEVSDDPGDLNNHPRWQRMLIAVAGPAANFLLAFCLMTAVYMLHNEVSAYESGPAVTDYISPQTAVAKTGIQPGDTIVHFDNVEKPTWDDVIQHAALNLNQTIPFSYIHDGKRVDTRVSLPFAQSSDQFSVESAIDLGLVPKMQDTPIKVETPTAGGPADRAGLKTNDQIESIDGLHIRSVQALLAYLADQKGKPAHLDVLRNGKHLQITVTPELTDSGDGSGTKEYHLGFLAFEPPTKIEQLSFSKSLVASWHYTKKNSLLIVDVIKGMFERHVSVKQLSGPIGIGQVVHEAAEAPGWMPLIGTISMISINLAMFNLLPFPILDGGMIFLLLVESAFQRDLPMAVKERIFQVAFVCILLFAAMVIYNDISKLPFIVRMRS